MIEYIISDVFPAFRKSQSGKSRTTCKCVFVNNKFFARTLGKNKFCKADAAIESICFNMRNIFTDCKGGYFHVIGKHLFANRSHRIRQSKISASLGIKQNFCDIFII